jgi:hypothetical protein
MVRMAWISGVLMGMLAGPAYALWDQPTVPVSVHGVNYSNEEFSYTVEDPDDAKNKAGGELINRFAAGGTMCCYDLPRQWRPGLQVKVNSTHWLPKQADGKLPEVKQTLVVDVPPYADGQLGELWVLRQADGSVKVVSSDYQPDHEKWPGEVKGWPAPSIEYRRERWALHLKLAEASLRDALQWRAEMERDMHAYAERVWPIFQKYRREEMKEFSGPDDPKLHAFLIEENSSLLASNKIKVQQLKEHQP